MTTSISNRATRLHTLLQEAFTPQWMDLCDESSQHQVPSGSESHFKLTLVSTQFRGQNRIERHRMVNEVVLPEMRTGLHALSMALYSPEEWAKQPQPLMTPPCQRKKTSS